MREFGRPITIVLDDLHTVTDIECMASLDLAIQRLPANARLIVITRADPVLELPRLRARGDLAELRESDLAFTAAETRELLVDRGGLDLADRAAGGPVAANRGLAGGRSTWPLCGCAASMIEAAR